MAKQTTYSGHSRHAVAKNGAAASKEMDSRDPRESPDVEERSDRQREPAVRAKPMKNINFSVTVEELRLLASLASDQLFRRQFIDPRMPGYKGSPEDVALGKSLVGRMRLIIDETQHVTSAMAPSRPSKERRIL
jgi:hypothetical protein